MPFKDLKESKTHHDKDGCIRCGECFGHYENVQDLRQHLAESIQCDFSSLETRADNNDLTNI